MKQSHIIALAVAATLLTGFLLFRGRKDNDPTPSAIKDIYNKWKAEYNLKIGSAENDFRLKIFTQNYELINKHNSVPGAKYQLGLNPYAHLTVSEFAATHLGFTKTKVPVPAPAPANDSGKICEKTTLADPDDIDWDAQGKVTRVKNQGSCGSCWAFSASGAIEGIIAITTGQATEFSEQQLVDCSTSYGNEGCNGGYMNLAFKYVTDHGIVTEPDYPYTGVDGTCSVPAGVPTARISGYRNVTANNTNALRSAVAQNPVSVAVEADSSDFQLYKSGVLTGDACGIELNHGVLAVGYGTLNGTAFWKVKNSWGSSWGNNGFILIERRDGPGTCGINIDASYPTHYC